VSTWRDSLIGSRGWYDIAMATICCAVFFWWAYEYIERLAR
jgi:hypothetical protein